MWFNSNYLTMVMLAAYPGHYRIDFGNTVTPGVNASTQALENVIATGSNPFATGGGVAAPYTYNDNSSGSFTFTPSQTITTIAEGAVVAREMAVFYHGYVQTGDDAMTEQSLLLYYEEFEEGMTVPQMATFANSVAYYITNYVRIFSPEEHPRIIPVAISGTDNIAPTVYAEAKLVMASINASVANTAAMFPKYLGDKTYAVSTGPFLHQATASQLAAYGSYNGYWNPINPVGKFRMNEDGTVTFNISFSLAEGTAWNENIGRVYFTVGSNRFDILMPNRGHLSVNGGTDMSLATEQFTSNRPSRETYEFQFTLGEPNEPLLYSKIPNRSGIPVKYPVRHRVHSTIQSMKTTAGAWTSYPSATEQTLKMSVPQSVKATEYCFYHNESNESLNMRIKHDETGVYVYHNRYSMYSSQNCIAGMIPGEYTVEVNKATNSGMPGVLSGIPTVLRERMRAESTETIVNNDLTKYDLARLRVSDKGQFKALEKDRVYTTMFGSELKFTDDGLKYNPKLSTGAYSGFSDSLRVVNNGTVDLLEFPIQEIEPAPVEVETFTYHAHVGTEYWTQESTRALRPPAVADTRGTATVTVAANTVNDLRVKNNLAFACRVEVYDDKETLLESTTLGASVLPSSQYTFKELQPGKYQLVYSSIGMELETDKRPYINLTTVVRRYDLLLVKSDISKPVFSIFKEDENERDWDVYLRGYNVTLVPHNWKSNVVTAMRAGRVTISGAGLVTFAPTINNTMMGIDERCFAYTLYSKDGKKVRHRQYRILVHPSIDIPTMPAVAVIDSVQVEKVTGTQYRITPKWTMYPTSRTYRDYDVAVTFGKTGTTVNKEVGANGKGGFTIDVARPITDIGILVYATDVLTATKRGTQHRVSFSPDDVLLTPNDFEIVNVDATWNEAVTLDWKAKTFNRNDWVGRPVWSVVGNPNGVTIRNNNQLTLTADVRESFKVRMYLRGVWMEQWIKPYPPIDEVSIIVPEGTNYPEVPIALRYSYKPVEALDNGEAVWRLYSGDTTWATLEGNILTFKPGSTVNRQVRVQLTYRGKVAYTYVNMTVPPANP